MSISGGNLVIVTIRCSSISSHEIVYMSLSIASVVMNENESDWLSAKI